MINIYEITFRRVILHEISQKQDGMEHAIAIPSNELFIFSQDVEDLIKERLAKAISSTTKAFEPEIVKTGQFFHYCERLKLQNNDDFIKTSANLAFALAESQKKNSIPCGYLIFIEGYNELGKTIFIALKAEMHTALRYEFDENKSKVKLLDDIFMTPSQKLFKVGAIYERDEERDEYSEPNNLFGSFFYDTQFSVDSKPAEYFWKDFLGFSLERNAKIQSKRFFDSTENFIKSYIETSEEKDSLMQVLKQEFVVNDEPQINPDDFSALYLQDPGIQDAYANEVAAYLPPSIEKDASLIKSKLERKKLTFPNKVVITGPEKTFEYNVEIIKHKDQIENIELESGEYTILKIIGKPYQE